MTNKFFWGEQAFDMRLIPVCILFGAILVSSAITLAPTSTPLANARGPVLVTLGFIYAYYNMIGHQVLIKSSPQKTEKASKLAERCLYNTLEQSVPFLTTFWMTAVFVDSSQATAVGAVYVAMRALYPVAYAFYGEFSMLCEFITMPNYMAILYFQARLLAFGLGWNLMEVVGKNFFVWVALLSLGEFMNFLVFWRFPFGKLAASWNLAYNSANKNK